MSTGRSLRGLIGPGPRAGLHAGYVRFVRPVAPEGAAEIGWGLGWALFAGLLVIAVAVRAHALEVGLNPDAGAYLYVGHVIAHGGVPYVNAIDDKGPLTYLLFSGVGLIAGTSEETVRMLLVVFVAAAGLGVAGYVTSLAGRWVGIAAGTVFALVSASPWQGADVNTEQIGVAPMAGAWWLATRAGNRAAAAAGALVGAATLLNVGFALVAIPVGFELWRSEVPEHRRRRLLSALGGVLIVALPLVLWLALSHALGPAVRDYLGFGSSAVGGSIHVPHALARRVGFEDWWIPALGALGALGARRAPRYRRAATGALVWIAVMLVRAKLSPYDGPQFAHHYYPLLPGAAVGFALGAATLLAAARRAYGPYVWRLAAVAGIALVVFYGVDEAFTPRPRRTLQSAAAYLRTHTRPGDRIIVSGYSPQVYWLAGREAASALFSVPKFGAISRTGNFQTTFGPRRLSFFLHRPPRAIVVPPGPEDWDIADVLYLLPYRRAFSSCHWVPEVPGCTSVWLLRSHHRTARRHPSRPVDARSGQPVSPA